MFIGLSKEVKTRLLLDSKKFTCVECGNGLFNDAKFGICCKNILCNNAVFTEDDVDGFKSLKECSVVGHGINVKSSVVKHLGSSIEVETEIECGVDIGPTILKKLTLVPYRCAITATKEFDNICMVVGDILTLSWTINIPMVTTDELH